MKSLYPEITPSFSETLAVDGIHRIYIEESGNKNGIPVIFLHGGPGSGCNENHRRYFNPGYYRIIIFDQRGCNRSSPAGEIRNNTTEDLLKDIEGIRLRLGIEKWVVFGGSWGATLGLLYAQQHPDRILALILRGTFLARQRDLDWFIKDGINRIFPDAWSEFVSVVPGEERDNLIEAFYSRMQGPDEGEKIRYARAWSAWTGKTVTYLLTEGGKFDPGNIEKIIHEVSIETHYARNRYFIEENQIISNVRKLPDVPVMIIHGRRDLTCALEASWELHSHIKDSELIIVREGGHLAGEPVMTDALVTATDHMVKLLS